MMILANRLTAEFLAENKVPAIFRLQPPPDSKIAAAETVIDKPHEVFAARRSMKPVSLSLRAGAHWGLGLKAYLQVTSPLRRYQDLTVHRQLKSYFGGAPLQYSEEDLRRIAATTEQAEKAARGLERSTEEYWILKVLTGKIGQVLQATVVHSDPRRSLIQLADLPYIAPLLPSPTHFPGTEVRVILEEVDPRLVKIIFREC
jgi:exoribonuclease-2